MTTEAPDRISYAELAERVRTVLGDDVTGPASELAVRAVVDGQALGNARFGLALLDALDQGARCVAPPEVEALGSRVVLDGAGCFGPLAMAVATYRALDLVATHGVALVAVRSVALVGRMAPYVEALAGQGLLALSGAASSAVVVPDGGGTPFVGTNPVTFALPSAGGTPLVLDIATSAGSMGSVHLAQEQGRSLPPGIAVDADGHETTDPAALAALLPRGGLLGTMMALVVEGLTTGLTGEDPSNASRTLSILATRADPASTDRLRDRLLSAGGREPNARSRELIAEAHRSGIALDPATRARVGRLPKA